MTIVLIASSLCVGALVYLLADWATVSGREREQSLRRAAGRGPAVHAIRPRSRSRGELAQPVARLVLRLFPRIRLEAVGLRLHAAGLAQRVTASELLAAKGALAGAGLAVAVVVAASGAGGARVVLVALALAIAGWRAPDALIRARAARRRDQILLELPDALDLLAVSVEAGLGFDAAAQKLVEQMDGPLVDELGFTLGEIRIGESRQQALKNLADRVHTPELAAVVRAIIQAEQQGSSLGRILRVQASDARARRQLRAEEQANKAPVKMLFPTVFFIFPSLFVVILGPAVMTIWTSL